MIECLILLVIIKLWPKKDKPKYYYQELTPEQVVQVEKIVESLLYKYPDALVGEEYPELVYKVLSEKRSRGEISKHEFENLTDKILQNL